MIANTCSIILERSECNWKMNTTLGTRTTFRQQQPFNLNFKEKQILKGKNESYITQTKPTI